MVPVCRFCCYTAAPKRKLTNPARVGLVFLSLFVLVVDSAFIGMIISKCGVVYHMIYVSANGIDTGQPAQ